ncbi:MAG: heavy metal translocating P-type ATPase [Myxococcales bacterium]|nr:heavy metal translocating P-type ATPase [Myxococcales bacterium]
MSSLPSSWYVKSDTRGRLRLRNPFIARSTAVVDAVEAALMRLEGVVSYAVNPKTSSVLIRYSPDELPREDLAATLDTVLSQALKMQDGGRPVAVTSGTALRVAMSSAALGLASTSLLVPPLTTVAHLGTLVAALPIFRSAAKGLLLERKLQVDLLDSITIALALKFRQTLPAALMVWLVVISDMLLDATFRSAKRRLTNLFGRQTRMAWRKLDGELEQVPVSALAVGDVVVVGTGEQIPVDGRVAAGGAMVDQSALTGEYAPAERVLDDTVYAMTAIVAGRLEVEATGTGEATNAARMVRILEQSLEHEVQMQTRSEKFADDMVLPTLGLGAFAHFSVSTSAMLAIINADFGTGVRIAGPLALLSSLSTAARNGVMVKNGAALEVIRQLDVMVFDKTGTLTEDIPDIGRVHVFSEGLEQDELLAWIAAAEQPFSHPVARAFLQAAERRRLVIPPLEFSDYEVGLGLRVGIDRHCLLVGSLRFMNLAGIAIDDSIEARLRETQAGGSSVVLAAIDGKLAGVVELRAAPRPEALELLRSLRDNWAIKKIYLISGDHEEATSAFANQLGIDDYFAGVLPSEKADLIKRLQDDGHRVGMVGDGINDAVALSQADCSFSVRGAADIAKDVADVVLMDGDLRQLEHAFQISDNLTSNVRRSIELTVVPNSVLIAGALFGVLGFGSSVVLNNVFNIIACINGLTAQRSLAPPAAVAPGESPPYESPAEDCASPHPHPPAMFRSI